MIFMQVKSISGKPYKNYFNLIGTFNAGVGCPLGMALFVLRGPFSFFAQISSWRKNMRTKKCFKEKERIELKKIIQEKTGYYIRGNCLLYQAFTRSSFAAEQGGENNEILEFIGDQVLSYYVVKIIAERFGALNSDYEYAFRVRENRFSALKQEFISNENLARIVDEWGIVEYLIVGRSDYANEIDKQVKVKADLFESILGAIAVASKWDSTILENAVSKMLSIDEKVNAIIENEYRPFMFDMENAINTLKELAEHRGCSVPKYEYGTPESLGYDKDGNPIWCCTCSITNDKTGIVRQVWASSKKAAKKAAAYLVLCDHFALQNQYGIDCKHGKLMPKHMMKD